ncbi:sensor histidine kinase [Paenibacillus lemnae]|uniref:histidine kinase n=1 Tax=Paenibacillus lemnae TaxID=1330551 RepID=A0A848MD51_PAELE|nr:HAMP domain-containing sensor histidine kinase [Paenibacillus lemnae]NMO97364.1 HAMP domain-containing histidine kinase [Paenibacillus lemnae]
MTHWKRITEGPRSLRYQLLSRSLIVLAILLLLIGFLQYVLMRNVIFRNQADMMHRQLRALPMEFRDAFSALPDRRGRSHGLVPPEEASDPDPGRRPLLFLPETSLAWIGADGEFEALPDNDYAPPRLDAASYLAILESSTYPDAERYRVVEGPDGDEQLIVFRLLGNPSSPQGMMQMGVNAAPLQEVIFRQLVTFAVLSLLALTGGVLLYLPLLRKTLTPLDNMVTAVQRTDAGNLNERFPARQGQEEIDRLAQSFNGMLERLDHSFRLEVEAKEQMRRFIADASHELRTPLTSIHGFLEVLLRGGISEEQLQSSLRSMHGESGRMKKLIEDLLLLARLDRSPELVLKEMRLDKLAAEMEPNLTILAGNRAASFEIEPDLCCFCDADKIKQVLLNLFYNAVQHTDPDKGCISVRLSRLKQSALLTVQDNGTGIQEEDLPHVFDRFYRSDVSRTRKSGGSGLGLAITKSIVEVHGGSISADSIVGKGTLFSVTLPLTD